MKCIALLVGIGIIIMDMIDLKQNLLFFVSNPIPSKCNPVH